MKKLILHTSLCLLLFFACYTLQAQSSPDEKKPAWISDKGFWVVESNKQTPRDAVVYFYNNESVLVYKEEIKDRKLNLKKKRTLLQLKAALEEAIDISASGAWVKQKGLVTTHLQD